MARRCGRLALLLFLTPLAGQAVEPAPDGSADAASHEWMAPAAGPPSLVLSFVGDIMHHELNAAMPDYDRLYDAVRELLLIDDLSFANIEFPVDPMRPPAGYPIFNGTVAYVEAAIRAGFDAFSLANNHTFDLRAPGVNATRLVFNELAANYGVFHNGIRATVGAPVEPAEIAHRGWRIGFVSITSFSNLGGGANWFHLVDYTSPAARQRFLAQVRGWSEEFDLLVVGVHAGIEYVMMPADHKVEFFREIADAGAHVVWGHHPHVLQPWELRGHAIIIYSAGNFVSAQRRYQSPWVPAGRWAPTGDTAVYQVRVEPGVDGARVTGVRTPLFTMFNHPRHGLVLRSFDDVLTSDPPVAGIPGRAGELGVIWRAFYFARHAVMSRFLGVNPPIDDPSIASR